MSGWRKLLPVAIVVAVIAMAVWPRGAEAHGEHAQEGFLRMRTIAWVDTQFAGGVAEGVAPGIPYAAGAVPRVHMKRGDTLEIKGRFLVLDAWPAQLHQLPARAFLNVAAFGPHFTVEERYINGVFTPGSFMLEKGRLYEYRMVLRARDEGEVHVHPVVNVRGVGPIVGPGQWVNIEGGSYSNPLTLWNGKTISDLETFGLNRIILWHALAALFMVALVAYWVRKPLVRRSMVIADAGEEEAERLLLSRTDVLVTGGLALAAGLTVLIGWAVTKAQYNNLIPHQVIVTEPPKLEQAGPPVAALATQARYNPLTAVLQMEVTVTNKGDTPVVPAQFTAAYLSFYNPSLRPDASRKLTVVGSEVIAPGETRQLILRMVDRAWEDEHLMELSQPQLRAAGALVLQDAFGRQTMVSVSPPALFPDFSLQ